MNSRLLLETACEQCGAMIEVTFDGGYCEECAMDNLPAGCDEAVRADV